MTASPQTTTDAPGRPPQIGSPEFVADPHRWYSWMRREEPVFHSEMRGIPGGAWFLTRYEDCAAITTDPRFVRNPPGAEPLQIPEAMRLMSTDTLIFKDDPEHKRLRGLVRAAFAPRAVARLGDRVQAIATELLDGMSPGQTLDLQADYAYKIPLVVISEMVGIPDERRAHFQEGWKTLTAGVATYGVQAAAEKVGELADDLRALIGERREARAGGAEDVGGIDIISDLLDAGDADDALTEDEIVATVFLLVIAGFETTQHVITNGVAALLAHPDQLEVLLADPQAHGATAVEEVLRWTGTIGGTKPERPLEDVELHGVTIPAGAFVIPLLASANRDGSVFDRPDVFDVTRDPNDHLAFSRGNHFCLGASLARMEIRTALLAFFERFPASRLAVAEQDLVRVPLPAWNRLDGLPVTLG